MFRKESWLGVSGLKEYSSDSVLIQHLGWTDGEALVKILVALSSIDMT